MNDGNQYDPNVYLDNAGEIIIYDFIQGAPGDMVRRIMKEEMLSENEAVKEVFKRYKITL
jgi:hypothetical protein